MVTLRQALALGAGLLFVAGILGYTYYQSRVYRAGPVITILSPQNGQTLTDPLVTINGTAQNISYLYLNDRRIFVDENGAFSEKLLLEPGYTIIQVEAQDRFNRTRVKTLELVYDGPSIAPLTPITASSSTATSTTSTTTAATTTPL